MNAILYHQKMKEDLNGRRIYMGEDAHPYADNEVIIVADGLGGRGGYPHTKINPQILDREAFYEFVFAPVFCVSVSEEFKAFVVNSFNEIFETKEYYFENSAATRCSGYFASRLVTAITLYELKYNENFQRERVFERLKSLPEEERVIFTQELGDKLAALLQEKLSVIATNISFQVETRIAGAYLLPSTLTVALIDEREEDAEILYLWAGDSRGYVWDETNGLGQVTRDHEKDETMTNLITLTKPFRIESRLINVKKPCLLFNATDGCYKCPVFDSPFDLEYIFLKSIDDSSDFNGTSMYLAEQFSQIGRHDDSNTMALLSLGFDGYETIQIAVRERLRVIEETIISRLPGILQINYPAELQFIEEQMGNNLFTMKDELISQEAIIDFVKKHMQDSYRPFLNEKKDLIEKENGYIAKLKELSTEIKLWIQGHWIEDPQLKKYTAAAHNFKGGFLGFGKKDPYQQYSDLSIRLNEVALEHKSATEAMIEKLKSANTKLEDVLNSLSDIKNVNSVEYDALLEDKAIMLQIVEFIHSIAKKESPTLLKYNGIVREMTDLNQMYVDFDAPAIDYLLDSIILGTFDINTIKMSPEDFAIIEALVSEYQESKERISSLDDEIAKLPDKYLIKYWDERAEQLISTIWQENSSLIPSSIVTTISDRMVKLKEKYEEMKACCEIREKIYAEYDVTYNRFYEESKI